MAKHSIEEVDQLMIQSGFDLRKLEFNRCLEEISSRDCSLAEIGDRSVFAPFSYFGGKRNVAPVVWEFFGSEVENYIEPFAGGAAVLLGRPGPYLTVQKRYVETINDKDAFVINAWRAMKYADPRELAAEAEIINSQQHLDALHRKLIHTYILLNRNIRGDERYFDPDLAAYWIAGIKHTVGAGFAVPSAYKRKMSPRVLISGWPLGSAEACISCYNYRLKHVNLMSCDWDEAVKSRTRTTLRGISAVFVDPPYPNKNRTPCYREDSGEVSDQAAQWAIETIAKDGGGKFRIAFCGYRYLYAELFEAAGWRMHAWKGGGYGLIGNGIGRSNAEQEAIWFSPQNK